MTLFEMLVIATWKSLWWIIPIVVISLKGDKIIEAVAKRIDK